MCCLPSPGQIYQLRGFIREGLQLADTPGGRGGKAFRFFHTVGKARSSAAESGEPLRRQCINKCADMLSCFFRYVMSTGTDLLDEIICRMLPVEELPYEDARKTQAKAMTRIRVEENGPVVKLLPEHGGRIGYGFFIVFHAGTFSPSTSRARRTFSGATKA